MPDRAETSSDVLVIGAGVIGLSCAWRLAQRGLRVRVLERDEPGAGATGVAAGMLAPVGEATWGEEELLELALHRTLLWPEFAAELAAGGPDPGFSPLGALHVALDRDEAAELRAALRADARAAASTPSGCAPGEARQLRARAGDRAPARRSAPARGGGRPRRSWSRAAGERARRRAPSSSPAPRSSRRWSRAERSPGVRDAAGTEHRADRVVLAAGSWSAAEWLPRAARPPVRPVKGQILTLRGAQARLQRIVASERVYLVPRPDGRLVVGATVEEMGFDTTITAGGVHELLREAYRALPEVAEMELVETRAGLRPGTPDNAPIVGPARSMGCCSPPATSATGSCWRR